MTVALSVLGVVGVLGLGGLLTRLGSWYDALRKPTWQPPGWLFGPAWTLIGALTAAAAVLAWNHAPAAAERSWVVGLFSVNAILNILWSGLFFTLRRPDWALAEVVVLWLSVLSLVLRFAPFSPTASLLLLPYLFWVGFAAFLNRAIVRLNGSFAAQPTG